MRILIDALFVKKGGGLTVLNEVLHSMPDRFDIDILIDESLRDTITSFCHYKCNFKWMKSSIFNKCFYYNVRKYDSIFALGNFPGVSIYKSNLFVYNMQYFLFDRAAIRGKLKLSWFMKYQVIRFLFKLTRPYLIVQSDWMRLIALKSGIAVKDIHVLPIFKDRLEFKNIDRHDSQKFLYITSNYPYKNNDKIIDLFRRHSHLDLYITIEGETSGNIHFLGALNHQDIVNCINLLRPTIIQASEVESFGITLIEAALSDSRLLVFDRPYVDSVVSECSRFYNWNHLEKFITNELPVKIPKSIVTNRVQKIWELLEKM